MIFGTPGLIRSGVNFLQGLEVRCSYPNLNSPFTFTSSYHAYPVNAQKLGAATTCSVGRRVQLSPAVSLGANRIGMVRTTRTTIKPQTYQRSPATTWA